MYPSRFRPVSKSWSYRAEKNSGLWWKILGVLALVALFVTLALAFHGCSRPRPMAAWSARENLALAIVIHGRLCPEFEARSPDLCAVEPKGATREAAIQEARARYRALCLPAPPEGEVWQLRCSAYREDLTQILGEEP